MTFKLFLVGLPLAGATTLFFPGHDRRAPVPLSAPVVIESMRLPPAPGTIERWQLVLPEGPSGPLQSIDDCAAIAAALVSSRVAASCRDASNGEALTFGGTDDA